MRFPPVKQKLPELFNLIITLDNALDVLKSAKIIRLSEYSKNKKLRQEYTKAAEHYIKRQRKSD